MVVGAEETDMVVGIEECEEADMVVGTEECEEADIVVGTEECGHRGWQDISGHGCWHRGNGHRGWHGGMRTSRLVWWNAKKRTSWMAQSKADIVDGTEESGHRGWHGGSGHRGWHREMRRSRNADIVVCTEECDESDVEVGKEETDIAGWRRGMRTLRIAGHKWTRCSKAARKLLEGRLLFPKSCSMAARKLLDGRPLFPKKADIKDGMEEADIAVGIEGAGTEDGIEEGRVRASAGGSFEAQDDDRDPWGGVGGMESLSGQNSPSPDQVEKIEKEASQKSGSITDVPRGLGVVGTVVMEAIKRFEMNVRPRIGIVFGDKGGIASITCKGCGGQKTSNEMNHRSRKSGEITITNKCGTCYRTQARDALDLLNRAYD
ncbi:hypothetical protein T492DRAFT_849027 [Pavlovales sp. CCMP2436]|nr:hypothetical protein T492DRAFT_849027 [Pavlovales sp. CCMP2436]